MARYSCCSCSGDAPRYHCKPSWKWIQVAFIFPHAANLRPLVSAMGHQTSLILPRRLLCLFNSSGLLASADLRYLLLLLGPDSHCAVTTGQAATGPASCMRMHKSASSMIGRLSSKPPAWSKSALLQNMVWSPNSNLAPLQETSETCQVQVQIAEAPKKLDTQLCQRHRVYTVFQVVEGQACAREFSNDENVYRQQIANLRHR